MKKNEQSNSKRRSVGDMAFSLVDNLPIAIKGIKDGMLLFVIAISIILIALVSIVLFKVQNISGFVYVVLGLIGFLAVLALIFVYLLLQQKKRGADNMKSEATKKKTQETESRETVEKHFSPNQEGGKLGNSEYETVYENLGSYPRFKFERVINAFLSVEELNYLPRPISVISKVEFLGYLKESNKLTEFNRFLRNSDQNKE